MDVLAECVQTLGGVARALASDVVEEGRLARAPSGDDGSNDLIVGQVVRGNELQSWFVLRHLMPRAAEPQAR